MRGSISAAMSSDASHGSMAGLRELEAVVSTNWENLLVDKTTTTVEKLKQWSKPIYEWFAGEPRHPLHAFNGNKSAETSANFSVHWHATFGKLNRQIRLQGSCVCGEVDTPGSVNNACALHGASVSLPDLLWEIIKVVHPVFDDKFMSFANVLLDESAKGRVT